MQKAHAKGHQKKKGAFCGQGNTLVTPLQLANYVATLVDGGDRYPAHLLKTVKSYDNTQVVYAYEPEPENEDPEPDGSFFFIDT